MLAKALILQDIADLPLEKVTMSDICFLPLHTSTIKIHLSYSLNGSWQGDRAETIRNPFWWWESELHIHFQVLVAASSIQYWWCWSCQAVQSLVKGRATAVSSLDQLCKVICITPTEGVPKSVYPTLSQILCYLCIYHGIDRYMCVYYQYPFSAFISRTGFNCVRYVSPADHLVPSPFYLSLLAQCKPSRHFSFTFLFPNKCSYNLWNNKIIVIGLNISILKSANSKHCGKILAYWQEVEKIFRIFNLHFVVILCLNNITIE